MFPYFIIYSFLLFSSFGEAFLKLNKTLRVYAFFIFSIFIFFFLGLRQCGFDYENYYHYFQALNSEYWKSNAEFLGAESGYAYLNFILGDYRLLLLVMAALTVLLQFVFIFKYSPIPFFTLYLYFSVVFYSFAMGQYRQALAVAFVLWAFVEKDKNKYLFLVFILLASLFHTSALLGLFAFVIPNRIISFKWYFFLLLIALCSSLFFGEIFYSYTDMLPSVLEKKTSFYGEVENGKHLGLNMAMLLRLSFFFLFFYERKYIMEYPLGPYFLNLYFVSLLIYLGLGFFPQLAGRGSAYFYFFEFFMPTFLVFKTTKKKKYLYFILFVLLGLYRQITFFHEWQDDYIPYYWGINYLKI